MDTIDWTESGVRGLIYELECLSTLISQLPDTVHQMDENCLECTCSEISEQIDQFRLQIINAFKEQKPDWNFQ